MYLIDTSILLELLLEQKRADDVEKFLQNTPKEELHLSEFSLYSLGIILFRRKQFRVFLRILDDLIITGGGHLLRLSAKEMEEVAEAAQRFNLDFDDAYQYAAAEKYGLKIVSFDGDFDRTEKGRIIPSE